MTKVYKFSAEWCSGCKQLSNTFNAIGDTTISLTDVDIDAEPALAKKYNVRSLPTLVIVDDMGQEIKRLVGNVPATKLHEFLK